MQKVKISKYLVKLWRGTSDNVMILQLRDTVVSCTTH